MLWIIKLGGNPLCWHNSSLGWGNFCSGYIITKNNNHAKKKRNERCKKRKVAILSLTPPIGDVTAFLRIGLNTWPLYKWELWCAAPGHDIVMSLVRMCGWQALREYPASSQSELLLRGLARKYRLRAVYTGGSLINAPSVNHEHTTYFNLV